MRAREDFAGALGYLRRPAPRTDFTVFAAGIN